VGGGSRERLFGVERKTEGGVNQAYDEIQVSGRRGTIKTISRRIPSLKKKKTGDIDKILEQHLQRTSGKKTTASNYPGDLKGASGVEQLASSRKPKKRGEEARETPRGKRFYP